jgi:dynein heavy chain 1
VSVQCLDIADSADGVAGLQLKIVAEDKVVDGRIADFLSEWETNK